jgi:molybdopterin molybdotransferase
MGPDDKSRDQIADVRMRGFSRRTTLRDALAWLNRRLHPLAAETVSLSDAAGRTLAEPISSHVDVPGFARAMMDGFALQAADTLGASCYNRLPLKVVGQILPGRSGDLQVTSGHAVRIMTGAPLPAGADAVLPAEKAESEGDTLFALAPLSPGKHVGQRGEDICAGSRVMERGRCLRPQDLGVLSSIGCRELQVVRRPRVRIVVTGNELLPPGSLPRGAQIADANSPMLAALVHRDGGLATNPGIVADEPTAILAALRQEADIVVVSGGSSVGAEDHTPSLVRQHGQLAIHGIAMRPSSPTGMGTLDGRLVFLLPGNPVSCLCAYDFFAGRAIRGLAGRNLAWPYRSVHRALQRKLVSTVGRTDYARVRLIDDRVEPLAISGASVLSSTSRADGFAIIPEDSEGLPAGAEIEVFLYD